jgi:hypothetical protein
MFFFGLEKNQRRVGEERGVLSRIYIEAAGSEF